MIPRYRLIIDIPWRLVAADEGGVGGITDIEHQQAVLITRDEGMVPLEDGSLIYHRDDRDAHPMIPMGDDLFMIKELGYFRIRFERDNNGKAVWLVGLYDSGDSDMNERD